MPYFNQPDSATDARVDALLQQMTLEEKVGQLAQFPPPQATEVAGALALDAELSELIRAGKVGSFLSIGDVRLINQLQRVAVEESRLGIPLIIGNDIIHGCRTIFPIPLAEACTWNPALLERAARVAAEEASALGTDWIFAPMVDISRDPRWGRIAEGAGEDVLLTSALGQARVRGFQAADLATGRLVAACPKHYLGYGAAEAGRDYNTVDLSERSLRETYLPPFQAAIAAGAGTLMSSFNEISGIPATVNSFLLRTILRDEWQWPGVVVSDYNAVLELLDHGIAEDMADATQQSILAGLDMEMASDGFIKHLADLVQAGKVPLALVDAAVHRVLALKFRLGLFDKPYADEALAEQLLLKDDARALALEVAQQSMVLLKNERGILPLTPGKQKIALIGPLAADQANLLGCWSGFGRAEDVESVLAGFQAYLEQGEQLRYTEGCPINAGEVSDFAAAIALAQQADLVVLVLGESADMSGEAHSRTRLGLPGRQQELANALAATGKPLITVLMTGRPLVIPQLAAQSQALLVAWHGGIRAGRAVADLIFGAANPSGKLTASWPHNEGQIPVYYAHKNTGRPATGAGTIQFTEPYRSNYLDAPNTPLFPFGYGLSYSRFSYSELLIETPKIARDGLLLLSAVVKNSSERDGDEIVQCYIRDLVGSVTRPVKELKGFQRISLKAGEARKVYFALSVEQFGLFNRELNYVVEPGSFQIWVGPSVHEGLLGEFEVI